MFSPLGIQRHVKLLPVQISKHAIRRHTRINCGEELLPLSTAKTMPRLSDKCTWCMWKCRQLRNLCVSALLADAEGFQWAILTPDHDVYIEELSDSNRDLTGFFYCGENGAIPAHIDPNTVYGFDPLTPQELGAFRMQGQILADAHRMSLGLPVAPPAAAPVAAPACSCCSGSGCPGGPSPIFAGSCSCSPCWRSRPFGTRGRDR